MTYWYVYRSHVSHYRSSIQVSILLCCPRTSRHYRFAQDPHQPEELVDTFFALSSSEHSGMYDILFRRMTQSTGPSELLQARKGKKRSLVLVQVVGRLY